MQTRPIAYASLVAGSLLLACSSNSSGLNTNSHDGSAAQGGSGTGGATHQAAGGAAGGPGGSGGHVIGGLGGNSSSGGNSGGNHGSSGGNSGGNHGSTGGNGGGDHGSTGGNNGTGGTTHCIQAPCILPICPYGIAPAPPCGCAGCLPPPDGGIDVGTSRDTGKDTPSTDAHPCLPVACPALLCRYGYVPSPTPCGCPTCVPGDAGAADMATNDATVCPPIVCPLLLCPVSVMSTPTACGCPTCGAVAQGK
jgi:hypothetical protein